MNRDQVNRHSPLDGLGYPSGIPTICKPSGMSRPISRFRPIEIYQRARIVTALTLLLVPDHIIAESHIQQSSVSRIETPLISPLETLGVDGRRASDVFLPASEAFALSLGAVTAESITVYWDIADGYYLYRDKFQFALAGDADQQVLSAVQFPAGQLKNDPTFDQVEVFYHRVQALIPWRWDVTSTTDITLDISYQGCANQGLCYPPVNTILTIEHPGIDR